MPPVIIAYALIMLGIGSGDPLAWVYCVVLALICIIYSTACVLLGHEAEAKWGKDPSEVVADETAGQCLTLMFIPAGICNCPMTTMGAVLGAFFLFRAFDILKPWPAGAMQKIAGGFAGLLTPHRLKHPRVLFDRVLRGLTNIGQSRKNSRDHGCPDKQQDHQTP